ncbi:hypothetical protein TH25_20850 [Thalassospira profundimaris]|jgi:hypothetical protein|uniref:Uncharacterized protein n=1 Tax=Thalassospira profundimaris TaxID=502049 RepID=A0A367WTE7_9PROT|nr:hypothetical protein [Thalassospira profundimaris]RCK43890.1 hypothetical protein TH25_20850 [Thalassospira profundimaris]|tara:strand:- start:145 stop:423 length:279 start_codon:yes stop_codon:yes gene_type:complete
MGPFDRVTALWARMFLMKKQSIGQKWHEKGNRPEFSHPCDNYAFEIACFMTARHTWHRDRQAFPCRLYHLPGHTSRMRPKVEKRGEAALAGL